jgi:hypothetical protein
LLFCGEPKKKKDMLDFGSLWPRGESDYADCNNSEDVANDNNNEQEDATPSPPQEDAQDSWFMMEQQIGLDEHDDDDDDARDEEEVPLAERIQSLEGRLKAADELLASLAELSPFSSRAPSPAPSPPLRASSEYRAASEAMEVCSRICSRTDLSYAQTTAHVDDEIFSSGSNNSEGGYCEQVRVPPPHTTVSRNIAKYTVKDKVIPAKDKYVARALDKGGYAKASRGDSVAHGC